MKGDKARKSSRAKTETKEKANDVADKSAAIDLLPVRNDYVFANLFVRPEVEGQ